MRQVNLKRYDSGSDLFEAYEVGEFDLSHFPLYSYKVKHKKDILAYRKVFASFDIESSTIIPDDDTMPYGFMYHWQMCIGGEIVYGRTWEEWLLLMDKLAKHFEVSRENRFVIYVHNLAYEFQFIRNFLDEYFGGFEVFASGSRKPMYVLCNNGIEFRCSYFLTNMTLAKACDNEKGVEHPKAIGDLDYKVIRTADTPLTDTEFGYCIADIVSLYELIVCRMRNDKDNLESIPMTSTGYVRRDCRNATRKNKRYRDFFKKNALSRSVYELLIEAGRGGNTHANRYMSGRLWHEVDSYDVASSYPAQILLKQYPIRSFSYYGSVDTYDELKKLINKRACLFRIQFNNLKLKPWITMPYIPYSKLLGRSFNIKLDNGRVLEADFCAITITDIDFKLIMEQYTWDSIAISDMYTAPYGDLPEEIRNKVLEYFKLKTELKDKIKHETNPGAKADLEYLYAKSKNKLNGIFGMMYTNPVRPVVKINDRGEWIEEVPDIDEALEKYNKSRNSFLVYAWGVWITAHARMHLQDLLDTTGEGTIYCDTDSSKCVSKAREAVEALNVGIRKLADERGAYVDYNDTRYYLGTYELETPTPYKSFKTLGAKKYAYVDDEGLHVTISGVNKKIGAKELKDIKNFTTGFIFNEAGGSTLYYNDISESHYITINGCRMLTGSNVGMVDSTYELGVTDEYAKLIGLTVEDLR